MEEFNKLLQELQQQEDLIQFIEFTNDTAYEIGTWLVDIGRREGKSFTVDICRNGQQLYHYALPGTTPDNDEWIKRKNRVVNRFNHSSYFMGIYYKSRNTTIEEKHFLNPEEYAPHGGSFPIIIKNVGVVGTITVSGLPQEEDHRLVVQVLMEFLGL
jgi:uncharacterized protein (UPF0303 family)